MWARRLLAAAGVLLVTLVALALTDAGVIVDLHVQRPGALQTHIFGVLVGDRAGGNGERSCEYLTRFSFRKVLVGGALTKRSRCPVLVWL